MSVPNWASALAATVAEDYGIELPEIVWRRSKRVQLARFVSETGTPLWGVKRIEHSSGNYQPVGHKVTVTAGSARRDQRLVLLHEMAHAIAQARPFGTRKLWHSAEFWELAHTLYRQYGVPVRYARERERGYRKLSEQGYRAARGNKRPSK